MVRQILRRIGLDVPRLDREVLRSTGGCGCIGVNPLWHRLRWDVNLNWGPGLDVRK